jgi:hypothetical protein
MEDSGAFPRQLALALVHYTAGHGNGEQNVPQFRAAVANNP